MCFVCVFVVFDVELVDLFVEFGEIDFGCCCGLWQQVGGGYVWQGIDFQVLELVLFVEVEVGVVVVVQFQCLVYFQCQMLGFGGDCWWQVGGKYFVYCVGLVFVFVVEDFLVVEENFVYWQCLVVEYFDGDFVVGDEVFQYYFVVIVFGQFDGWL